MAPRITRRLSASGVVLFVTSFLLVGPAAADACAGHVGVRLTEWPTDDQSPQSQSHIDDQPVFYWGVENAGNVSFTMQVFGHSCQDPETSVQWATENGTAAAPGDYTAQSGSKQLEGWDIDWPSHTVSVPIANDSGTDSRAAEWFKAKITGGEANIRPPSEAPIFIVDDEGSHRVTLPDSPYNSVQISETAAQTPNPDVQIPVFRAGPATEQVVVGYTITSGAGITAGDYTDMTSGSVTIPAGQRMALIKLAITDDLEDEADEQLTAEIAAPAGATVETDTSTVTIIDNDIPGGDQTAPKTSFHHPKHNRIYKRTNYLARTIHVFAPGPELEPSGIEYAQTALRRTKTSGKCGWWNGTSWTPDGCKKAALHRHWLPTWFFDPWNDKLIYEYPKSPNALDPLKPSIGTKVKNYFVYARAEDGAGNLEDTFEMGRNKNRFEVKKG